jgi:hypothetical protein
VWKTDAPTPGKKHTLLLGKCICKANENHPDIQYPIEIDECPPREKTVFAALKSVGIETNGKLQEEVLNVALFCLQKYENKPEFDWSLFTIEPEEHACQCSQSPSSGCCSKAP